MRSLKRDLWSLCRPGREPVCRMRHPLADKIRLAKAENFLSRLLLKELANLQQLPDKLNKVPQTRVSVLEV